VDATHSLLAAVHQTLSEDVALQALLGVPAAQEAASRIHLIQAAKDSSMPYLVMDIQDTARVDSVVHDARLIIDLWDWLGVTNLTRIQDLRERVGQLLGNKTFATANATFLLKRSRGEFLEVNSSDGLVRRYEMTFAVRMHSHDE
jgi:redox-regulated HSP33 family molecular chaperone